MHCQNAQRILSLTLTSLETGSFYCHCCSTSRIEPSLFLLICVTSSLFKVQGRGMWLIKPRSYTLAAREAGRGVSCLCSFYSDRWILLSTKISKKGHLQLQEGHLDIWQPRTKHSKQNTSNQCPPQTPTSRLHFISWEQSISKHFFFFSFQLASNIDIERPQKIKTLRATAKKVRKLPGISWLGLLKL